MQNRRLLLNEQKRAAVRERDRLRASERREIADVDTVTTSGRRIRRHISHLRAGMSKEKRNRKEEANRKRNVVSRRTVKIVPRQGKR